LKNKKEERWKRMTEKEALVEDLGRDFVCKVSVEQNLNDKRNIRNEKMEHEVPRPHLPPSRLFQRKETPADRAALEDREQKRLAREREKKERKAAKMERL
jgi:hypothetical protein